MNATQNTTVSFESEQPGDVYRILWLVGISVSILGVVIKISFFILIPQCRKYDIKVLFQLTLARTLNTICEYCIVFIALPNYIIKCTVFTLYLQTDLVLVLWMLVFSKNLHNKIVVVFGVERPSVLLMTIVIWTVSLPFGLLCPFLIKIGHLYIYYEIYAHIKLLVIIVNALIFYQIFSVAIRNGNSNGRNIKDLIKTSIIAFILICITSLQIFITDIVSYYYYKYSYLINIFCVINSYQVIAVSVIFFSLVKSQTNKSILRSVSIKLRDVAQKSNI